MSGWLTLNHSNSFQCNVDLSQLQKPVMAGMFPHNWEHINVRARVGIQRHSGDLISELIERSGAAAAPPKTQTGLENALFWALLCILGCKRDTRIGGKLLYTGWQRCSELNNRLNCCIFIRVFESWANSNVLHNSQSLASPCSIQIVSGVFCLILSDLIELSKIQLWFYHNLIFV